MFVFAIVVMAIGIRINMEMRAERFPQCSVSSFRRSDGHRQDGERSSGGGSRSHRLHHVKRQTTSFAITMRLRIAAVVVVSVFGRSVSVGVSFISFCVFLKARNRNLFSTWSSS